MTGLINEHLRLLPDTLDYSIEQNEEELLEIINGPQDRDSIVYSLLFKTLGLSNNSFTVIPFLERDPDYNGMPGRILRINNIYGMDVNDPQREVVSKNIEEALPIPIIEADVVQGIPIEDQEVDLFVASHGVFLTEVFTPESFAFYVSEIKRVLKRGGFVISLDEKLQAKDQWKRFSLGLPASRVIITLTDSLVESMNKKGIFSRPERSDSRDLMDFLPIMPGFEYDLVLLKSFS
jgi:SAM-dependent methyltransferase